jgi:hypothetical protein
MSAKPTGCANCGKPRPEPTRNHNKANSGTRIPSSLWIVSVETDPFCSAECCRIFHGLRVTTADDLGSCPDCGKQHTTKTERPCGNRCQRCSDRYRKRRQHRYDIKGCCAGCGVDFAETTRDCPTCLDRARRRSRRANDPEFAAREKGYKRAQRARAAAKNGVSLCAVGSLLTPGDSGASADGETAQDAPLTFSSLTQTAA